MFANVLTAQNAIALLLFLFPLAGNIVQHWTGVIYSCLLIIALVARPWRTCCLAKLEKRVLLITVLFFFSAITSNLVNTWTETQTKGLGVLLRYLAFVPIYFLIRNHPDALKPLTYGSTVGAILLAISASLETLETGSARAFGIYASPGLIATQATVFILVVTCALRSARWASIEFWILLIGVGCGIHSLLLSGSRSGYLAALVVLILYIFLEAKKKMMFHFFVGLLALLMLVFQASETFRTQSISGVSEVRSYINAENNLISTEHQSVGQRLEMWRASILIFQEKPLFGVGWRNFSNAAYSHVEAGRANPQILGSPHPHNTYLEFLVSFGLAGLLFLILLFVNLFKISLLENKGKALLLKYFLLFYLVNAVNEGGLFIYGNSLSFFLIYLAVLSAEIVKANNRVINAQRNSGSCANAP